MSPVTAPEPAVGTASVSSRLASLASDSRLVATARSWLLSVIEENDLADLFTGPHPDGRFQVVSVTEEGLLADIVLRTSDDFEFNGFRRELKDALG